MKKPADIDAYIAALPEATQHALEAVRVAIRKAAPKAAEGISYAMPAFFLEGRGLVYFGGYQKHIGLYPIPNSDPVLRKALTRYEAGKGTLQFPLDERMPVGLIARVVKARTREVMAKHAAGAKKK